MEQSLNFREEFHANMTRKRHIQQLLKSFRGFYEVQHFRKGKLIGNYTIHNDITNEGKNYILEVMFHGGTQIIAASWFIALVNDSGFTAFNASDVMNSHAGWTEFTAYTQSTRVAWGPGTAASQSITNATPATFDINATGTVHGIFIPSNSTKSGTTGILWSTAPFAAAVPVSNGDEMKISYTLAC